MTFFPLKLSAVLFLFLGATAGALELEYYPRLQYDDEALHIRLRSTPNTSLRATAEPAAKWPDTHIETDASGRAELTVDAHTLAELSSIRVSSDDSPTPQQLRIVHSRKGLPALIPRGLSLYADELPCTVVVQRKTRKLARKWEPLKLAVHGLFKSRRPDAVCLLSDLPISDQKHPAVSVSAPPVELTTLPILDSLARACQQTVKPTHSVVLCLGSKDIHAGTPPRQFRLGLEAIVQHLASLGCRDVRLVMPLAAARDEARYGVMRSEIGDVAFIYRLGSIMYPNQEKTAELWHPEEDNRVSLALPRAETREVLAQQLIEFGREAR